jgi:amylosucrase/maltose alpha-D-glucosyltransferase/alpha-amylase
VETGSKHVLGFSRYNEQSLVFVLGNFTEQPQRLEARGLRRMGMRKSMVDLFAGRTITATNELTLDPYQLMILTRIV